MQTPLKWLVTGCSAGFGEAFVSAIVARGDYVVATARKISDIRRFQSDRVAILQLDITDPEEVIQAKVDAAIDMFGGIDVLVNNAGYLQGGPFEAISSEQLENQFRTNYFGTLNVTRAILPYFRERRSGNLVFIGSQAGCVGDVCSSAYSGSKFALEGTADCIGLETEKFGIKTYTFEPGRCRTRVFDTKKSMFLSDSAIGDYDPIYNGIKNVVASFHNKKGELESFEYDQLGDPAKVVDIILDVVRDEGVAKGKTKPKRLPMGSDAIDRIRLRALETLKICDEWESVIRSVDPVQ